MTKEQALARVEQLLRENQEIQEFAYKHNKLDLWAGAKTDREALYEAAECIKESIKNDRAAEAIEKAGNPI
jgi:hypothetical protein